MYSGSENAKFAFLGRSAEGSAEARRATCRSAQFAAEHLCDVKINGLLYALDRCGELVRQVPEVNSAYREALEDEICASKRHHEEPNN